MEYIGITKKELLRKLPRLYRFVSINDTLELFDSKSLSFKSPSQWKDPFESFYLSKQYQIKDKIMDLPIKDKIFACCFSSENYEASWKIYTPNNDGVRITFDTEKLLDQLKSQNKNVKFFIGKVNYQTTRNYFSMKKDYQPGDLGFNTKLSFLKKDGTFMLDAELNNGRLAMIGSLGMICQELVSNQCIF